MLDNNSKKEGWRGRDHMRFNLDFKNLILIKSYILTEQNSLSQHFYAWKLKKKPLDSNSMAIIVVSDNVFVSIVHLHGKLIYASSLTLI